MDSFCVFILCKSFFMEFDTRWSLLPKHIAGPNKMAIILLTAFLQCIFCWKKILCFDPNFTIVGSYGSNKSPLMNVIAWCWIVDKLLPESMMTEFTDAYMCHHAWMTLSLIFHPVSKFIIKEAKGFWYNAPCCPQIDWWENNSSVTQRNQYPVSMRPCVTPDFRVWCIRVIIMMIPQLLSIYMNVSKECRRL